MTAANVVISNLAGDPFDRVLDRLETHGCRVIRRGPTRARSTCPTHNDRRPSLSLDLREGHVLLRCWGGCPTHQILTKLGLTWGDLFAEPRATEPETRERVHVVATYSYADMAGHVYARKVRLGPHKSFRWELLDGDRWRRGLSGRRPALYGLEHAVEASPVLVVEGEKAVDCLHEHHFPAVCPPSGASLWHDAWSVLLWRAGCRVAAVLPDADRPGRHHAVRVAASLHGARPTLPEPLDEDDPFGVVLHPDDPEAAPLATKIVELPDLRHGEDVVDWLLTHGHTTHHLRDLVARSPFWTPPDPLTRRRTLTRERVRRYRERQRAARLERAA